MKPWANDYGDVPHWYWVPALEARPPRRKRRLALSAVLASLLVSR